MSKQEISKVERIKSIIWFSVRIVVAVGIVGYLIFSKKEELVDVFSNITYKWIVFAFLLYLIHLLFGALRWKLIMNIQKVNITFFETFSIFIQSFFFSLVIPGGAVGGDLVKVGLLTSRTPKGTRLESAFTILIDRVIGMISLFSLAIYAFVVSISQVMNMDEYWKVTIISLFLACLAGISVTVVIYFHRQLEKISLIARCIEFGDKLSKGMVTRLTNAMDLYKQSYKTLLSCIVISIFGIHLNIILICMFLLKGLNHDLISFKGLLFSVVFGLIASLVPITPAGVGTRDAVMGYLLGLNGVGNGVETALPLVFTAFVLVFNFSGGLFFIFQPKKRRLDTEKALSEME